MTQIKDIIHNLAGRVDSATVKETAYTAADKVFNHQQKAVVVNDERNQACGIVFEKDVIHAFRSKGKDLLKTPITDIMSIDLVAATPNDSIEDALQLMAEKDIHLLPIINDKGTITDFLSINDVIRARLNDMMDGHKPPKPSEKSSAK